VLWIHTLLVEVMRMNMRPTSVVLVLLLCALFGAASAAAQANVTLSFAENAGGGQFAPNLSLGEQFMPLGVHFNYSGATLLVSGPPILDGRSTHSDDWCSGGGYNCAPNNIVVASTQSGGQTFDTLRITFDTQQSLVEMDIDAGFLGNSTSVNVTLKSGGGVVANRTLTEGNEIGSCFSTQTATQLCGRFLLSVGGSWTFDEIDISPTSIDPVNLGTCQATSGDTTHNPECGGVYIDNLSFTTNAGPVPIARTGNSAGQATSAFCPGDTAVFDGSTSRDTLGLPLTYSWTDNLDNPSLFSGTLTGATPSIVIPNSPGTYTVQLTATDPFPISQKKSVPVYVKSNNQAPVVQAASPASTVTSGANVMLDGTQSYDPDGDPISYQWIQTGGPAVTLTNSTTSQPSFTSPQVTYPSTATLTFQLTATDQPSSTVCGGSLSSTATVNVTVEGLNHPPVANAGQAQTATSGSQVTLNGSSSADPDGDGIAYNWMQTAGTPVTLLNPTAPMPTFIAPDEPVGGQETLTFQLVVTDLPAAGYTPLSSSATVNVTVQHPSAPPDCSKAVASRTTLWAPDHRMVGPVSVINATDNAPGTVTIETLSIYQDEPTSGLGSGDTSPDAVINSDGTFFLRAERAGTGDGRVYHINFTATNASGGSCSGVVTVCVPHDMGKGSVCVDEGPLYDSTH
jgi:hypothetical protein